MGPDGLILTLVALLKIAWHQRNSFTKTFVMRNSTAPVFMNLFHVQVLVKKITKWTKCHRTHWKIKQMKLNSVKSRPNRNVVCQISSLLKYLIKTLTKEKQHIFSY